MGALRVAWIACLFVSAFAIASPVAKADNPVPPKAVVWIEPIADSGGAGEKMSDNETLARRFTKGLRVALEGEARERFDVRIAARSVPASSPAVRFVLRGGLSRVQGVGEVSSDQPFLCIVRLFREIPLTVGGKPTRRLVGQWAGTARGLRDLTGNLARDPRVHALGLAGELSRRITAAALRIATPTAAVTPPRAPSPGSDNDGPPAVLVLEGGIAAALSPSPSSEPTPIAK